MRELTTRALARLAREPNGRAGLLESDSAIALLLKLGDSDKEEQEEVRGNCLAAMIELGRDVPCRAALIAAGGVEQLVATAPSEVEALQPAALAALRGMMMALPGLEQAIAAGAISAMISLLAAPAAAVREKVAPTPPPPAPPYYPSHCRAHPCTRCTHTPLHPLHPPCTLHPAYRLTPRAYPPRRRCASVPSRWKPRRRRPHARRAASRCSSGCSGARRRRMRGRRARLCSPRCVVVGSE